MHLLSFLGDYERYKPRSHFMTRWSIIEGVVLETTVIDSD